MKKVLLAVALASSMLSTSSSPRREMPAHLERLISWLPADTETITVANGPFVFRDNSAREESQDRAISDKEVLQDFQHLPLATIEFKDGVLAKHLDGKQIVEAVEGARHFRAPADLGMMPFEGCSIVIFSADLHESIVSFLKEGRRIATGVEHIEGQEVLVFTEQMEGDTWSAFVSFPDDHTVIAATERGYLSEVLARRNGRAAKRALPSDLPEWAYIDTDAPSWGLRHYDRSQAQSDPSSPFGGQKAANFPDEKAVGFTFAFNPTSQSATITYLSDDPKIGSMLGTGPIRRDDPEAESLHTKYREVVPGVLEGSYSLRRLEGEQFFLFVLMGELGHGIYL